MHLHLPPNHPKVKLTKTKHRMIVATGIIVCGTVQICYPDVNGLHVVNGTIINLFWLLLEPEAS